VEENNTSSSEENFWI